jgi:hypothetical protein
MNADVVSVTIRFLMPGVRCKQHARRVALAEDLAWPER